MKASKKIFSLVLGTSMFFTGMPECFAMMADDGQDSTRPLSTNVPSEEAAGDSSGPASPDMTDVDISPLFQDIVSSEGTTSSRPGTAVLLPSEGEGEGVVRPQAVEDVAADDEIASSRSGTPVPLPSGGAGAVQPQIVGNVAADAGTASSEHGSSTSSLADSAAHDAEPEVRDDVPPSDETLRRSVSPDTSSDEGETSGEVVAPQPQVIREGEPLDGSLDVGPAAGAGTGA